MFALAPEGAEMLAGHPNFDAGLQRMETRRSMQATTWGRRLERVKDGLFVAHHGVGSEEWSPDGFVRL